MHNRTHKQSGVFHHRQHLFTFNIILTFKLELLSAEHKTTFSATSVARILNELWEVNFCSRPLGPEFFERGRKLGAMYILFLIYVC
jgi:hypothetical protein